VVRWTALRQQDGQAMLTGSRPTDRSKDRLTVSRFSSQAENQPNLNVFLHTIEVVDPAPIRLVSPSLPITRRIAIGLRV
jgi:hypothetical protein